MTLTLHASPIAVPDEAFALTLEPMETLGKRLRHARVQAHLTQQQIADAIGITRESVSFWENDKSKPDDLDEVLEVYHRLTGITPGEIITKGGVQPVPAAPVYDPADMVLVEFYPDAAVSAGHGAANEGTQGRRMGLAFRAESLRRKGINPQTSAVIPVRGRSMEPLLSSGDVVLFDKSQIRIHDGEVYVVHWNGDELVKVLRPLPGGHIMLASKNPEFAPIEITPTDDEFRVLGRVMWRSGWM